MNKMKIYFKHICFCFLAIGLYSCDEDDDLDFEAAGANVALVDNSISLFDQNEDLTIELTSFDNEIQSVEIQGSEGTILTEATISSDDTATFSTSTLGELTVGESITGFIISTLSNGQVVRQPFNIEVTKALTLGDNATETTMDSLSSITLDYEVSTLSADVDDVILELKKNSDGTYTDSDVDLETENGSVMLSETNYTDLDLEVNDTLYYRFTATSGSLSDVTSGQVAITPKAFTNSNSATLSNDLMMNQLNLGSGEVTADGTEGGEIRFLEPTGFEVIEGSNIDFVQVDEDFFDDADVLTARAAYENGTAMESFTNLENGDTFVYRTTRDVEDEDGNSETFNFYGVFQIGNVTVVDGTVVSFDIDYAEGF